jgi:peptidyl-prolyl cis-trans isomerase D
MSFAIFRRYQKRLLAVLAVFAMVAFTLDFSLLQNFMGGPADDNPEVARIHGRTYRRGDLAPMKIQRSVANRFMAGLLAMTGQPAGAPYFGGLDDRSIVDALILEHKADELGMPQTIDLSRKWLRTLTDNQLTTTLFDRIFRETFGDEPITGEQVLAAISNQLRLARVQNLPGVPQITPLDVYQAYRDQYEKVSAFAVPFYAEDYVAKIADPSDAEEKAYFEKYKDALPDSSTETPGFKVPRRVAVEFVAADAESLAKTWKSKLTEKELRDAYKERPDEFLGPKPELPVALFAGAPELTPVITDPFREVKPMIESTVAFERAQEEVNEKFAVIRDDVMGPFSDDYHQTVADNKDAQEAKAAAKPLPKPGDIVKTAAAKAGLSYEKTPLLTEAEAERYGLIGMARQGTTPTLDGRPFAEVLFEGKSLLYDPVEFTDLTGRRYLIWKVADEPARVPAFDEVKTQVARAWKLEKARALAEKDAQAFAEKVREAKGDIKAVAGTKTVLTTLPVPRLSPGGMLGNPFQPEPARPSEIPQIPDAGESLRDALFSLGPKTVAVEPNAPKTVYYVMTLNQNIPAEFAALYSPVGPKTPLQNEVFSDAYRRLSEEWMGMLRKEAGVPREGIAIDEDDETSAG